MLAGIKRLVRKAVNGSIFPADRSRRTFQGYI